MKRGKRILDPEFKKKIDLTLKDLKQTLYDLYETAIRDGKTGAYNYRFFMNIFEMEIDKAKRGKQNLSIISIDIDFFKKINDTYGHLVGDGILIELVNTLNKVIRKYDILARVGGEEFFILLPETSVKKAQTVAGRLLKCLWNNSVLKKYEVTISLGLTEYKPKDTIEKMIKRADEALYLSKKNGRNRISHL